MLFCSKESVTSVPCIAWARALLVVAVLCGWLVITNHCTLGLMPAVTAASGSVIAEEPTSHCPRHATAPVPQDSGQNAKQCCKAVHAVQADGTKAGFAGFEVDWERIVYVVVAILDLTESARPLPELLDTGPPRAFSFSELVLQQSLFGHAPPPLL